MKKVIGNLNGHPIVVGDENLVTKNEYFCRTEGGKILLFKRNLSNKLQCATISDTEDVMGASLFNLEEDTLNEIKDILTD